MKDAWKRWKVEWLPITGLRVHPRVQRAFDEHHARKIAAEFDPDTFGVLSVVPGSGSTYLVVDGQHRLWAAREALGKDQAVPCRIFAGADEPECAALFLKVNRYKLVRAFDRFVQRSVSGDAVAVGINAVLKRFGLRVGASANGASIVQAVVALEVLYARGPEHLAEVLKVIHEAWSSASDGYHAHILQGVGLLLRHGGEALDRRDLSRRMTKYGTPLALLGDAKQLQRYSGYTPKRAIAERLLVLYNKGRSKNRVDALPSTD